MHPFYAKIHAAKGFGMLMIFVVGTAWATRLEAQNTIIPFYDMNQNGIRDENEPEVKSLTVTVSDSTQITLSVRLIETYAFVVVPSDSENSLQREAELTATTLLPTAVALYANYPNPFNPTTFLRFDLPSDALVSLQIWDVLGNVVATLVEGERKAGSHTVAFEAAGLPSGIYFAKFQTGDFAQTRRLVLAK